MLNEVYYEAFSSGKNMTVYSNITVPRNVSIKYKTKSLFITA